MTRIPYVYRLTDLETGKRYIGSRYGKVCEPDDLGVSYFTSSETVSRLFRANPKRFEKQIIVTGTVNYVIGVEKTLIDLYDAVMSEDFYNRTNNRAIHPDDIPKTNGQRNIDNGWMSRLRDINMASGHLQSIASSGGKASGKLAAERGQIQQLGKDSNAKIKGTQAAKDRSRAGGTAAGKISKERVASMGRKYGVLHGKLNGENTSKQRYQCLECSLCSTPAAVGMHQKATSHIGKEKLNVQG